MLKNLIFIIGILTLLGGCPPSGAEGGGGSSPLTFLPFVLIFVLFYFLILRPQRKQSRVRDQMLKGLKRGDDVITSGGIYGKILSISEDGVITLEIAKTVSVKIARSGITSLQSQGNDESKSKEEKSKK